MKGANAMPSRIMSAPTPRGPPSLCAESTMASAPSAAKSISQATGCLHGIHVHHSAELAEPPRQPPRPAGLRRSRYWPASGSRARAPSARAPARVSPLPPRRRRRRSSEPAAQRARAPEARAGSSTKSCSIAETQISSQPAAITQLLASVAPLVNTTSLGLAFTSRATSSRARSTIARTRTPLGVHR